MRTLAFRLFAASAVAATAALHIYSFFREIPPALLTIAVMCAIFLFLTLAAVSFWDVRGRKLPEAWQVHWREAMAASPRILKIIFLFAWMSGVVAIGRMMLSGPPHVVQFHTAWCVGASTMALSFAIGSRRMGAKNGRTSRNEKA